MGQQKQFGKDCLVIPISFTSFLSGLLLSEKASCPCYCLNHPFSSSRDPTSHLLTVHTLFFSNVIIQSKCLLIFSILLTRQTCSRVYIPFMKPLSVSILQGNHPRVLFAYAAFTNSPHKLSSTSSCQSHPSGTCTRVPLSLHVQVFSKL